MSSFDMEGDIYAHKILPAAKTITSDLQWLSAMLLAHCSLVINLFSKQDCPYFSRITTHQIGNIYHFLVTKSFSCLDSRSCHRDKEEGPEEGYTEVNNGRSQG